MQVVDGPDKGRRFLFDADPTGTNLVSGGRNNSNRIVLTDEHVSDVHFELLLHEQGVVLRSRKSLNGVYAYGLRIRDVWIKPGMVFQVGHSTLELIEAEPYAT